MDRAQVLAAFTAQIRRRSQPDPTGALIEAGDTVVRWTGKDGGWSGILWSDLDESDADRAIGDQVAYFGGLGRRFEWKLYSGDRPADLGRRLLAAGFRPEAEESLMVAETTAVAAEPVLPDGVELLPVTDQAGLALLIRAHEQVFGDDRSDLRQALLAQLRDAPGTVGLVVAVADGEPVCAARIEFQTDSDFAGLWGGGTLPAWRGRGIYRALVAYRAGLAAARGIRYLQVDASAQSAPILVRLGFSRLAVTTPYLWEPGR